MTDQSWDGIRDGFLPYARQALDEDDIEAVARVLRSDYLTTGPAVESFEKAFASVVGSRFAVAVSSGTAALHAAIRATDVGKGDEVIVSPMTFAASANAILYEGGTPVFADVLPDTLLIDPNNVARKVTDATRAILAVDYAGQPCDYDALRSISESNELTIIADACHAIGGALNGQPVGSIADYSVFSFHPVKHIAAGEGGMVTTDDETAASRMKVFRNHGITTDHHARAGSGSWFYEMVELGYNYRLSDIHSALGESQLKKLGSSVNRRRAIAQQYNDSFFEMPGISPLVESLGARHAYHLYPVLIDREQEIGREEVFRRLRDANIGVNVHYIPVHLHPYYRERFGTHRGQCPVAEDAYDRMISLPMFPSMTDADVEYVIHSVARALGDPH